MANRGMLGLMGGGIKSVGLRDFDRFLDFLVNEQSGSAEKSPAAIYKSVAWAYRCVNLRAWGVSTIPYIICKRGAPEDAEQDDNGKGGIDFPMMTRDLLWRSEAAECLWAVNYVLKAANPFGVVKRLDWLNPLTMTPDIKAGVLLGFEQTVGAEKKNFKPEQVIYAPQFNPTSDLGPGVSAMQVAMEAAGLAVNANLWASRFFSHGAIPAVILSNEGGGTIPPEEITRIRKAWDKLVGGVKNAFRTVVLGNGLKPTIIGMPVKDLAMPELYQQVRAQIACAFEIPEAMLADSANYATALEHRRSFWMETIVPHAEWHAEVFNRQLFWPMGLEMRLQPEKLEAAQKDEADKAASMKAMIDAATAVFGAKLCDEKEARSIISVAFENMSLPKLDENWTPPKPVIPPALQPFTGNNPAEKPTEGQQEGNSMENPPAPAKAMLEDLQRWQRKCEKAGKARPFESESIPAGMKALIDQRLEQDADGAFDFLKKADPARLAAEKRLREALVAELARQHGFFAKRIAAGQEPDWDEFTTGLANAVDHVLVGSYTAQIMRDAMTVGIDFDVAVINAAAWKWAREYGAQLAAQLGDTTKKAVGEAVAKFVGTPGMTIGDLKDILDPSFSENRAQQIAVTETTRAFSAATDVYQTMLGDAGLRFDRVWNTSEDERVCEICGPLADKREGEWSDPPPAHVGCRCWATLRYVGRVKDNG